MGFHEVFRGKIGLAVVLIMFSRLKSAKDRPNKYFQGKTLENTTRPFDARISLLGRVRRRARVFQKAEHPNFRDWYFLICSDHFESMLGVAHFNYLN